MIVLQAGTDSMFFLWLAFGVPLAGIIGLIVGLICAGLSGYLFYTRFNRMSRRSKRIIIVLLTGGALTESCIVAGFVLLTSSIFPGLLTL